MDIIEKLHALADRAQKQAAAKNMNDIPKAGDASTPRRAVLPVVAATMMACNRPSSNREEKAQSPEARGRQKQIPKPSSEIPMLLHTDTMQAELYHTARRAYQGTAEKKYQDRKELYGLPIKYRESVDTMIEELYKQLHYPGRVPGLKRLPPKPMMYCVQDEEFDMQGFYRFVENIGATAIVTSTATLDDLTDNGCLKFGLAHEIAHMIIRLQPELAGSLLPNDIRIGQEIVDRNLRDNDEMRQFAEELVADRIAMTITRDLRHARVFLQMIDKNHKKLIPKLAAEFVEEERLKRGDTYTSIEREVRTKEAVQQFEKIITTGFGVHPTNALRFALLEDYRKELAEKDQGGRYRVY